MQVMRSKSVLAASLLLTFVVVVTSQTRDDDKKKQERQTTECDKKIGGIMCDDFQPNMTDCAGKLPPEELQIFCDCGSEVSLVDQKCTIKDLLAKVCSQETPVKMAWDLIDCWNEKMEEAVKTMKDQTKYPMAHFRCKKGIFKSVMKKASCQCRMEKGMGCDLPTGMGNTMG